VRFTIKSNEFYIVISKFTKAQTEKTYLPSRKQVFCSIDTFEKLCAAEEVIKRTTKQLFDQLAQKAKVVEGMKTT
jgi:hypothetical protein